VCAIVPFVCPRHIAIIELYFVVATADVSAVYNEYNAISDFLLLFIYLINATKDPKVIDMQQRLLVLNDTNIHKYTKHTNNKQYT